MTTVIETYLETVLSEEAAVEVAAPAIESRALVFVVGPRVGQPVSIAPTPRPGPNTFSSRLASVLPRRDSSPSSEASEAAVQQVRRMLHRIRTTSESEAWGVSPIETYMERRFRGKDS
jgi:hypothetical protein